MLIPAFGIHLVPLAANKQEETFFAVVFRPDGLLGAPMFELRGANPLKASRGRKRRCVACHGQRSSFPGAEGPDSRLSFGTRGVAGTSKLT